MLAVLLKERNQSEQSIRASESIKNAIITSSLDAVITINHQGKIIEFNPEAERMFGYSRAEALGNSLAGLIIPPSLRERHSRGLAHNLATGESRILGKVVEMQAMRADGSKFPAELSVVRIDLDELTVFTGQIRDLTERKRAELRAYQDRAKIAHATRVATMAELTASLAHQISQPLAAIATLSRAAQRWLSRTTPDLDETRKALEDIDAGCGRASEVIRSVRAMYRKDDREKNRLSVNDVIEDTLKFLHADIQRYQVSVRTELPRDLPQVIADRTQLQQVFLNLITNALQAMDPVTNGERFLVVKSGLRGPETVGITVEDSGTGIDPSDMKRIFDAHFTTKSDGMGIGLSICHSIIDAHGGRLWASPRTPHGSVFHVDLPTSS
jgi:PAS domain S-box-containing protein